MIILAVLLTVAVAATLWNMEYNNDGTANVAITVTVVIFIFFVWAQTRAESEHELKHAAEHHIVQEQIKSLQDF